MKLKFFGWILKYNHLLEIWIIIHTCKKISYCKLQILEVLNFQIFFEFFFSKNFFTKIFFYKFFFGDNFFYRFFFWRKFFFSQKYLCEDFFLNIFGNFFCIWCLRNNVFCEIFYPKFCLSRIFWFCNFGVRKKNCKFFLRFFFQRWSWIPNLKMFLFWKK